MNFSSDKRRSFIYRVVQINVYQRVYCAALTNSLIDIFDAFFSYTSKLKTLVTTTEITETHNIFGHPVKDTTISQNSDHYNFFSINFR